MKFFYDILNCVAGIGGPDPPSEITEPEKS